MNDSARIEILERKVEAILRYNRRRCEADKLPPDWRPTEME